MKTTTPSTLPAAKPMPVAPAASAAPLAPLPAAPTRDYFAGQIRSLEKTLAEAVAAEDAARRHRAQMEGALSLARGQLALFFPNPPAPAPTAEKPAASAAT